MFEGGQEPAQGKKGFDSLMTYTYEKYLQKDQPLPYVFEVKNGEKKLVYFGAKHFYDPEDEQVEEVSRAWEDFLKRTAGQDALVLVEGGTRDVAINEVTAIERDGEAGLISYLAAQAGVSVESPEPPKSYEIDELLKSFKKEEILYYYFARAVAQWHRTDKSVDWESYIRQILSDEARGLGYQSDFLGVISEIHHRIFSAKLDVNDEDHFNQAEDPTVITSVSSEVARATSILRDQYILGEVEKKWKEGKSLFVVYGGTHAVMQEPALRALLEQNNLH